MQVDAVLRRGAPSERSCVDPRAVRQPRAGAGAAGRRRCGAGSSEGGRGRRRSRPGCAAEALSRPLGGCSRTCGLAGGAVGALGWRQPALRPLLGRPGRDQPEDGADRDRLPLGRDDLRRAARTPARAPRHRPCRWSPRRAPRPRRRCPRRPSASGTRSLPKRTHPSPGGSAKPGQPLLNRLTFSLQQCGCPLIAGEPAGAGVGTFVGTGDGVASGGIDGGTAGGSITGAPRSW